MVCFSFSFEHYLNQAILNPSMFKITLHVNCISNMIYVYEYIFAKKIGESCSFITKVPLLKEF